MTILHIIIAWLSLFAGFLIWSRIRDNKRAGRTLFDFGFFRFLVVSFAFAFLTWLLLFLFRPEPKFQSADEQVRYGMETHQPWITNEGLQKKIDSNPEDINLHFQLLKNHFAIRNSELRPPSPDYFNKEDDHLYTYYSDLSRSTDSTMHDIGHTMMAYYLLMQKEPEYTGASMSLHLVYDPTTSYVNFLAGKIAPEPQFAEEHYFSEIRNKGYKKGAYEGLALIYASQENDSALRALVYSGADKFIPAELRTKVYYEDRDAFRFYQLKIRTMFEGMNAWGISGGIAILSIWLFFLWSLTFNSRISVFRLMIPVMVGALLAMTSWWIYAFYKHGLGFWMNGAILNDVVFSVGGIGFIEELVKLVPFLFFLHFTRMIRKPIDYIVVASACGLGFAVFENLMYIANYGLDVIHSRALTSSLSHMACSGIAAYGFVLRKYRWPERWWLIPLFFVFAVIAHGFYDFWLLNEKVRSLGIFTLFFFLTEIVIYFSFINSALNQSVTGTEMPLRFDSAKTTSVLAGAFVLLFTFEYLATCLVYGTRYGNASISAAFLSGGYLVFFISVRMAQVRIQPGKWMRIDYISGILPSHLFSSRQEEETEDTDPDETVS